MRDKVFGLIVVCCFLMGQVNAQIPGFMFHKKQGNTLSVRSKLSLPSAKQNIFSTVSMNAVYRPVVAYRTNFVESGSEQIEYAYDSYGNIILEKQYYFDNGNKIPGYEWTAAYYKLANGEFRRILNDDGNYRSSAEYDSKGLLLWKEDFCLYDVEDPWMYSYRKESVLNENGISVGFLEYDRDTHQMEDAGYTFDSKGCVIHFENNSERRSYTWGDDDKITEMTFHYKNLSEYEQDVQDIVCSNIEIVLNEEYFNPYHIHPEEQESEERGIEELSRDYYVLHRWFINADLTIDGVQATIRSSINTTKDERIIVLTVDGTVTSSDTLKILDNNGSWRLTSFDGYEIITDETIFNEYGSLVKYSTEDDYYSELVRFVREYDDQQRPVKTTCFAKDGTKVYEETYNDWVLINFTGIKQTEEPQITVYPNPATDYIVVKGAPLSTVTVSDLSGRTIYRQAHTGESKNIATASWESGIYLVTVQTEHTKVVSKILKK